MNNLNLVGYADFDMHIIYIFYNNSHSVILITMNRNISPLSQKVNKR